MIFNARDRIIRGPHDAIVGHNLLLGFVRRVVPDLRMAPRSVASYLLEHERAAADGMVRVHASLGSRPACSILAVLVS